jgi:hypothetical protein
MPARKSGTAGQQAAGIAALARIVPNLLAGVPKGWDRCLAKKI